MEVIDSFMKALAGIVFIWYIFPAVFLFFLMPISAYLSLTTDYYTDGISLGSVVSLIIAWAVGTVISLIPFINYSFVEYMIDNYRRDSSVLKNIKGRSTKHNLVVEKIILIKKKSLDIFEKIINTPFLKAKDK